MKKRSPEPERGRGQAPRVEETEDGRTDGERDWKKVRGKVLTVFHSADSAWFQACEIAAAAAAETEEEAELVMIGPLLPVSQTASPGDGGGGEGSYRCAPTVCL